MARNIFGFLALPIYRNKMEFSKRLVTEYLVDWGGKDLIARYIRDMGMAVDYITSKCRRNLKLLKYKFEILIDRKWEKQFLELSTVLAMGNDKQKSLRSNMYKITPQDKRYICEVFFYRQKIENKLKFCVWCRKRHEDKIRFNGITEIDRYGPHIAKFEQQLAIIDTFLSKGVEKHKLTCKGSKKLKVSPSKILSAEQVDENALASGLSSNAASSFQSGPMSPTMLNIKKHKSKDKLKHDHDHHHENHAVQGMLDIVKAICSHDQSAFPPKFELFDHHQPNQLKRLIVRAAIVKTSEIIKFEEDLAAFYKKMEIS
jgi:hypothetical protein